MLTRFMKFVMTFFILVGFILGFGIPPASGATWWSPPAGTDWQWQLSGKVNLSVQSPVFDIDGEDNTAATVAALHAKGAHVICYFDAGGWENYRSDADAFPESVRGGRSAGGPMRGGWTSAS